MKYKKYKYLGKTKDYTGEDIVYYGEKYWYPYEHLTLWENDYVTVVDERPGEYLITKFGTMSWRLGDYHVWENYMMFDYTPEQIICK